MEPALPVDDDTPPRFDVPDVLEGGIEGVGFGVALDDAGGLSTNDVSVVLWKPSSQLLGSLNTSLDRT